ncbi:M16 family metallopeptidase [Umezakia ovalisporum]|uniref:Insulinase family protein n=2 Tax=Umezakia ovalisporum TaxID=75695 RepID=A0AA43GXD7_9CYAN|nr:pitrilysin family protein [Umezakia ovalisporum]MBI1242941.1 insulinase family protein [Nostoc sp. RI_552]MDH6058751.1 insulinase family protein [Umezakia ovalisporum FSS-43]MDH6063205.1 insulinase family protein [Umezakia ovalisporum FSS-62]MDH6068907.1 insulinase family protein [Umezakia ovalisporum APH033B]MDH6072081.1 insulinase family protein [Umezakia ovalisporum CobakiLakeA]
MPLKIFNLQFRFAKGQAIFYSLIFVVACLLVSFNFSLAATAAAKHYTDLELPPLPEIKLPKYERFVLENGLVVYLMEDHHLPLVSGIALVRTGHRFEPNEQIGLASLTGEVMRTGGTQKHSAHQLNDILEQRAAIVETSIGTTSGNASFESLSEDLETVFDLFAEVLREPVFDQKQLDLAKTQGKGTVARRNDDPDNIANREFQKLIYGQDSPYARTMEYATLDNISRQDLVQFYQQYFHPNNMILGIVGDFKPQKMRSLIQAKFGNWQSHTQITHPQLSEIKPAHTGGVFFVHQPQLTQSSILMGHLGGKFDSPDYAALDVLNGVLNGFGGRLLNEVRSRQGLAYSVYAYWSARFDYPGMFIAGGQTRSDATVQFVQALQAQIKRIQTQPITPQELAFAKESTLNSFVFNFQDPSQTLSRLVRYEYYGYPADFLFRYQKAVAATTETDVQRVARQYLNPDKLITLVVGNQNAIKPPLTQLAASVTPIDVTIPSPQAQAQN